MGGKTQLHGDLLALLLVVILEVVVSGHLPGCLAAVHKPYVTSFPWKKEKGGKEKKSFFFLPNFFCSSGQGYHGTT